MGAYTRLTTKEIKLRGDTPKEAIQWLKDEIGGLNTSITPDHHFFTLKRHTSLFHANPNTKGATFFEQEDGRVAITMDSDVNYCHEEILAFADWIAPYVVGHKPREFIGVYKTEGIDQRTNLYIYRGLPSDWSRVYGN